MAVERADESPPSLDEAVKRSLRDVLSQNSNLAGLVSETLRNGDPEQMPVIFAALEMIKQFDQTASDLVDVQGKIMPGNEPALKVPEKEPEPAGRRSRRTRSSRKRSQELQQEASGEKRESTAGTFANLLRKRVEEKLPPGKRSITKKEVIKVAKKVLAVKKAIAAEKLPARQVKFSRDEAVRIITRVLTTPRKNFKPEGSYNRTQLTNRFGITAQKLDELSKTARFDWNQNPTVDSETALQIRGLSQLGKTSGRKRS